MNLLSQKFIKDLLKSKGIRPSKHLGQHFILQRVPLCQLLGAAELKPTDIVLEIGPGLGTLTIALAEEVKKVIAIEKDKRLVEVLKEILKSQNINNVEIVQGDILKCQMSNVKCQIKSKIQISKSYKLVANLPYYITAPVIRTFLEAKNPPDSMVLMVQKEVGQRICAKPPKMSKLSVFCQFFSHVKIIAKVNKSAFWPQPKVDSVIIKFKQITAPKGVDINKFSKIVKAGFSQPRKQLINNLSKDLNLSKDKTGEWLEENSIKPSQRAETLSVDKWAGLAKTFI